jgi:hypothetical protein
MEVHDEDILHSNGERNGIRGITRLEYSVILLIVALTAALIFPDLSVQVEDVFARVVTRIIPAS